MNFGYKLKVMLSLFKRTFILLILTAILANSFIFSTEKTSAASCTFNFSPSPVTRNGGDITVLISSTDLVSGNYYARWATGTRLGSPQRNITLDNRGEGKFTLKSSVNGWIPGNYDLYLIKEGKIGEYDKVFDCKGSFTVEDNVTQSCQLHIDNANLTPEDDVTLRIDGTIAASNDNGLNTGGYDILINGIFKFVHNTSTGTRLALGPFPSGEYKVEMKQRCGLGGLECTAGRVPANICSPVGFRVVGRGQTGGGEIKFEEAQALTTSVCLKNPELCSKAGGQRCPNGEEGIMTAIGCVPTKPQQLVEGLLRYGTMAAGGVAFLLMILAAIQMITAEGNAETIKTSQEKFFSAIIGLLLVIFSVLLMQVIGMDILGLRGFGR